jgi:hypothetical protein
LARSEFTFGIACGRKHVTDPLVSAERHFCPGLSEAPWLYPCFHCPSPHDSHGNGTVNEWHNFSQLLPAAGSVGGVWGGAHDQSQNVVESFLDGAIQSIFASDCIMGGSSAALHQAVLVQIRC